MIMSIFQKFINKKKLKNNCNKNQLKTENNYDNNNFEKKRFKEQLYRVTKWKRVKRIRTFKF